MKRVDKDMKVLVIPDIHLKPYIFDAAEKILKDGKADQAVCLMDIADDWNKEYDISLYASTYDRAIDFAKRFPATLWCYGNHDISYVWNKLETGYSPYAEKTVCTKIKELEKQVGKNIAFIHKVDKVIFCHGGLSSYFVSTLHDRLPDLHIDSIIATTNSLSKKELWMDHSPLWLRPQYGEVAMFHSDEFKQVIGHTPVEKIYEKNGVISTDVFSTYRDGTQIGESAMIVIETTTGEYEKIPVSKEEVNGNGKTI